jgi:hypothetical protein
MAEGGSVSTGTAGGTHVDLVNTADATITEFHDWTNNGTNGMSESVAWVLYLDDRELYLCSAHGTNGCPHVDICKKEREVLEA